MDTVAGLPRRVFFASVATGVAYGLATRLIFGISPLEGLFGVMSTSFIFVVPIIIGFVTVYLSEPEGTTKWARWLFMPWLSGLLTIASALVLAWEGLICAIVWIPIFLVMASLGGLIAGLSRKAAKGSRPLVLASVAIVPFILAPVENQLPDMGTERLVVDRIEIAADPAAVWAEIREVPPIGAEELGPSFAHAIGFPRPIEARLEGEGVGSVRYATFEGDVTFIETVTEWVENESLAFTIDAEGVPPTTFDEHVAVGGRFFDVLEGRYTIEPLGPGRTALILSSRQRLSTRFNGYTQLWTDLFMRDIQQNILAVIKARAES